MAAQDYTSVVQQLYISYFGRPADYYGLQNFSNALAALDTKGEFKTFAAVNAAVQADKAGTTALSKLVNSFNTSTESAALYGTDNSQIGISKFVAAIYQNVLGREADKAGFDFWVNAITTGTLTKANAAASITAAAMVNTSAQGMLDAQTVTNKLAVATSFTTAIDTPSEITAYAGDAAAASARGLLANVNNTTNVTAYQATVDSTLSNMVSVANPGATVSLTGGVDTLAGTAGNDVFNALSVTANGAAGNTLTNFDSVEGGAGKDTLNIYTDNAGNINNTLGANVSVKNVETINIYNANTAANIADASKFVGATAIWQIGAAADVTKLDATTTAGFRNLGVSTLNVGAADAAATASVALDSVTEGSTVNVTAGVAGKLATVNLSGNVLDGADAGTVAGNTPTNLNVTVGKDVQTVTVNSSFATNLGVTSNGTKLITTINAAGSTGAITYTDTDANVANITTGAGKDAVTLVTATVKDDATTTDTDETYTASVNTGAGDDKIIVNVTGNGAVSVIAGDGNDTVTVNGRGTATLNIDLGAGNDVFKVGAGVSIGANDKIDAGAGTDMLALNLVGSANVGAFSNFDAFDAAGLGHALDIEILSQKNTVTEIVATADVGAGASLVNVGAGVSYRVTGDTDVTNALNITQKTAGDLTVTLDIDESGDAAVTTATSADAAVITNATGVKVVFDSSFVDEADGAGDNVAAMTVTATAAKTMTVVSGGDNASNVLTLGAGAAALTGITVTGASELTIVGSTGAAKLATIDASAATGGLNASLATVIDGGSIKLGSGADMITITNASTTGAFESISGFEKTGVVSISTATGDATAKAAAIADADVLSFSGAVADALAVTGGAVTAKGVLTFTGSGPSTLADAAGIANLAANADGEALVFEYLGNSYVFVQGGAAADTLVQLTGVTGITNLVENGTTDHFFIV
jgi:hypothetical protein